MFGKPSDAARPFGLAAALVLVFMMLFTTFTVASRQFFDFPILGVVDVMELSLVAMIFIAMPGVFLRDENVTVDVIDQVISRKARVALRFFGLIITLGFLIVMMIEMIEPALDKLEFAEVTMTLSINRFTHWVPIILGFGLSIISTVWVVVHYWRAGVPTDSTLDGPREDSAL